MVQVEQSGELWPQEQRRMMWSCHPLGVGNLQALVRCVPIQDKEAPVKATDVVVTAISEYTELKVRTNPFTPVPFTSNQLFHHKAVHI